MPEIKDCRLKKSRVELKNIVNKIFDLRKVLSNIYIHNLKLQHKIGLSSYFLVYRQPKTTPTRVFQIDSNFRATMKSNIKLRSDYSLIFYV